MGGWFGPCRKALATALLALLPGVGGGQGLLTAESSAADESTAAFLVEDSRFAVTLGMAGSSLDRVRLADDAGAEAAAKVWDPVSRLVVFKLAEGDQAIAGFRLAPGSPSGGLLRTPDGQVGGRIDRRVEQVSGKYLPFTLLHLLYDGPQPKPGTPLLDAGGSVAAIAHTTAADRAGYAVPVEVVKRVLDGAHGKGPMRRAWLGLTLSPAEGRAEIKRVIPDSPASRAGLREGDRLVQIGSLRVDDYGDVVNAFFLLRPGRPTKIRVRRGDVEMLLEVTPERDDR